MSKAKTTIKEQIKNHMELGYGLSQGSANTITRSQSAARAMRSIMQFEGSKYVYFMAEPQNKDRSPYKVFFKNIDRLIKIEKTPNSTFILVGKLNKFMKTRSREFNSRKSALNAIKSCN